MAKLSPKEVAAKTGMKVEAVSKKTSDTKAYRENEPTRPRIDDKPKKSGETEFSKTGGPPRTQKQMKDRGL
jgi:hypothetical protein